MLRRVCKKPLKKLLETRFRMSRQVRLGVRENFPPSIEIISSGLCPYDSFHRIEESRPVAAYQSSGVNITRQTVVSSVSKMLNEFRSFHISNKIGVEVANKANINRALHLGIGKVY